MLIDNSLMFRMYSSAHAVWGSPMFLAIVSASTLVAGVAFAVPTGGKPTGAEARREMAGGSLLIAGLMLLGIGLHAAGG